MEDKKSLWRPRHESYSETIEYLKKRKSGDIKSILTPWERLNSATINGLEWGNALLLASRPGIGKSLWKDQFVREAFRLNPDQNFRTLEFEWEMSSVTTNVRELSAHLQKSYQYMCSASHEHEGKLTDREIDQCIKYFALKVSKVKEKWDSKIDTISEQLTVANFEDACEQYAASCPEENILVTVDHVRLGERGSDNEVDYLYKFAKAIIRLKKRNRKNKMSFILLNHLNRNIDIATRCEERKYGNYIVESDILGADALQQAVEVTIGLDCPAQRQIRFYGPSGFIIEDERVLVAHYLKVRNGAKGLCFNRALYEQMQIVEIDTPPKAVAKTTEEKKDYKNSNQQTKANL